MSRQFFYHRSASGVGALVQRSRDLGVVLAARDRISYCPLFSRDADGRWVT